jgi:hypothetical protein
VSLDRDELDLDDDVAISVDDGLVDRGGRVLGASHVADEVAEELGSGDLRIVQMSQELAPSILADGLLRGQGLTAWLRRGWRTWHGCMRGDKSNSMICVGKKSNSIPAVSVHWAGVPPPSRSRTTRRTRQSRA